MDAISARLDGLKKEAQENISALEELQGGVQQDRTAAVDLLNKGRVAQQVQMGHRIPDLSPAARRKNVLASWSCSLMCDDTFRSCCLIFACRSSTSCWTESTLLNLKRRPHWRAWQTGRTSWTTSSEPWEVRAAALCPSSVWCGVKLMMWCRWCHRNTSTHL